MTTSTFQGKPQGGKRTGMHRSGRSLTAEGSASTKALAGNKPRPVTGKARRPVCMHVCINKSSLPPNVTGVPNMMCRKRRNYSGKQFANQGNPKYAPLRQSGGHIF